METGSRVGRYEIREKIGSGGMGDVYRAVDTELGREAALKVLSPELAADEDRVRRFIREAKSASGLNHPNILTVYEIGKDNGGRFIAAELVHGATLRDRLRLGDLSLDDGLSIALQTSAALSAAHDAGIVHRDIKPENIMVRADGLVKVLDFGLAKLTEKQPETADADADTATLHTAPGMILGTISYMSPEQARGKELDPRTDIFSLGIVLYEMFTGKRPFTGDGQVDIISAILKDEPPPLRQVAPDLPRQLERIVGKTLRKNRGSRYQHVKDLQIDLEDLREELRFEARSTRDLEPTVLARIQTTNSEFTKPTLTESIAATRRFTLLHAMLFVAAAVALVAGVWFLRPFWMSPSLDIRSLKTSEVATWNSAPGELFSSARFSPDGKLIAFSSTRTGGKNIWVKQTTAAEGIQVTNDGFSNQDPVWSPAGDEIAFFSQRQVSPDGQSTTGIWRVTALGGTPRAVGPLSDGGAELRRWTAGGRIYYQSGGALHAMDVSSGASEKVISFDPSVGRVVWTSISPDERTIALMVEADGRWKLFTGAAGTDVRSLIAEGEGSIGGVAWLPEKNVFFYSVAVEGIYQAFRLDRSGRPERITSSESDSVVVDAAPDGGSVICSSAKEESNIWRVSADGEQEGPVFRSMSPVLWPAVSADGRRIAYQAPKNLNRGNNLFWSPIYIREAAPGEDKATQLSAGGFLPAWAPDGSAVAFLRYVKDGYQLMSANPNGGGERVAASDGIKAIGYSVSPYNPIQSAAFDWSPDSSRIAYVSDRGGVSNVWAVSPGNGSDVQLTDNADPNFTHYCPIWSPDGNSLAYLLQGRVVGGDNRPVRSFNVLVANEKKAIVVDDKPGAVSRLIGWTASGDELIVAETDKSVGIPKETILKRIVVKTGAKTEIAKLTNGYFYNIALSPDRRTVAFAARNDGMDDIWIVPAAGGTPRKLSANNDSELYISRLAWSGDGSWLFFGKQTRFSILSLISGLN